MSDRLQSGSASLALLGLLTAGLAPAQEPLEEVIVTTTRRAESEQRIPVSITAVSGEQLAQLGVTQTRDLANLVPNLSTQGSFGRTSPAYFIRGIGSTQFNPNANSKVGVYVDDVYLNSPAVHGAQLFDIERIEVARGPQGYLFGQNTTGGLIRAITRKPEVGSGLQGDAELTLGRFGQIGVEAALGGDLGTTAAWRLAATREQRDGISRNTLRDADEGNTRALAWRGQLLLQPSAAFKLLASVHGSNDDSEFAPYKQIGLVDPETGGPCANPGMGSGCTDYFGYADTTDYHQGQWDVPEQVAEVRAFGASVTLDWDLESVLLTAVSAYEKNDSLINEDTDAGPLDVVHGGYRAGPRQYSQELRLTSKDTGGVKWIAGLYYFDERFEGTVHFAVNGFGPGIFTGVGTTLEGAGQQSRMQTRSAAAFGTVEIPLAEATRLSVGLRYTRESKDLDYVAFITDTGSVDPAWQIDWNSVTDLALFQTVDFHRDRSWNNVSGRVSLDHRFTDDVLGYVGVARGFNSGNFNGGALFDQSEASLVDPELLTSYETGIKSKIADGRVRLNAALYYYDFKDQQVFILASGSGGTPFQQLSNAAASTLYGAEVELAWAPARGLLLQLGGGTTQSNFDEFNSQLGGDLSGNKLPSAPDLNFNFLARYEWPAFGGTLAVQADGKYLDDQFFNVNNDPILAQDAYTVVDARVSYTTAGGNLTATLWGKNLADKQYATGAYDLAAFGFDQLVVGDQRSYGVTLSYRLR
jgi:iron complex outermembrane receptor protein